MAKLKLSSPWVLFYHEVDAFFKQDTSVNVILDDNDPDNLQLNIYVGDSYCEPKPEAIRKLFPEKKEFGDQTLWINIVPSNENHCESRKGYYELPNTTEDLFRAAFYTNPAFDDVKVVRGVFSNPIYYVIFAKEVVQYFTDDLSDAHGVRSTLYQDIANDIFVPMEGVYYNTNVAEVRF